MPTNQTHRQAFERDTIPKPVGLGSFQASGQSSSRFHQVVIKLWPETAAIVAGVRHGS